MRHPQKRTPGAGAGQIKVAATRLFREEGQMFRPPRKHYRFIQLRMSMYERAETESRRSAVSLLALLRPAV